MKSVFMSLFVILALGTQLVSVAAKAMTHEDFTNHIVAAHNISNLGETRAETIEACCDEELDKKPVTTSCKSDCKFFPVVFFINFPQTHTEHTQSDKFWIAAMPTRHHLRPPIS